MVTLTNGPRFVSDNQVGEWVKVRLDTEVIVREACFCYAFSLQDNAAETPAIAGIHLIGDIDIGG